MKTIKLTEMELFYALESVKESKKNVDFVYHETKITDHPDREHIQEMKKEVNNLIIKLTNAYNKTV